MSEEVSLFFSLGPESNGVGERVHGLSVTSNKGTTEIYVRHFMFLGL